MGFTSWPPDRFRHRGPRRQDDSITHFINFNRKREVKADPGMRGPRSAFMEHRCAPSLLLSVSCSLQLEKTTGKKAPAKRASQHCHGLKPGFLSPPGPGPISLFRPQEVFKDDEGGIQGWEAALPFSWQESGGIGWEDDRENVCQSECPQTPSHGYTMSREPESPYLRARFDCSY